MTRKPATHDNIIALDSAVEKVAKFGKKMLKVAVH